MPQLSLVLSAALIPALVFGVHVVRPLIIGRCSLPHSCLVVLFTTASFRTPRHPPHRHPPCVTSCFPVDVGSAAACACMDGEHDEDVAGLRACKPIGMHGVFLHMYRVLLATNDLAEGLHACISRTRCSIHAAAASQVQRPKGCLMAVCVGGVTCQSGL